MNGLPGLQTLAQSRLQAIPPSAFCSAATFSINNQRVLRSLIQRLRHQLPYGGVYFVWLSDLDHPRHHVNFLVGRYHGLRRPGIDCHYFSRPLSTPPQARLWCLLLRQNTCLVLRQDRCLLLRQDRWPLLRQDRCLMVRQGAALSHYFTSVWSQQKTSVLSQQQTSVLSQQQTSVLSQQQTSVLSQQKTSVLSQQQTSAASAAAWRSWRGLGQKLTKTIEFLCV